MDQPAPQDPADNVVPARIPRPPRVWWRRHAYRGQLRRTEGAALVIAGTEVSYVPPVKRPRGGWTLRRGSGSGQVDHVRRVRGPILFGLASGRSITFEVDGYGFFDRTGARVAWLSAYDAAVFTNWAGYQRFAPQEVRPAVEMAGIPWDESTAVGHRALNRACPGAVPVAWVAFAWGMGAFWLLSGLLFFAMGVQAAQDGSPGLAVAVSLVFATLFAAVGLFTSPLGLDRLDRRARSRDVR
jgi:hypothetical protein